MEAKPPTAAKHIPFVETVGKVKIAHNNRTELTKHKRKAIIISLWQDLNIQITLKHNL
jgi:hypothetical protein